MFSKVFFRSFCKSSFIFFFFILFSTNARSFTYSTTCKPEYVAAKGGFLWEFKSYRKSQGSGRKLNSTSTIVPAQGSCFGLRTQARMVCNDAYRRKKLSPNCTYFCAAFASSRMCTDREFTKYYIKGY